MNGPYALITTAVAADLGTQPSLLTRARALATITAIIDGTGSFGEHQLNLPTLSTFVNHYCKRIIFVEQLIKDDKSAGFWALAGPDRGGNQIKQK